MKFLIIGKNGQLAKEFEKQLIKRNIEYYSVGRSECDITNLTHVLVLFDSIKPDIVINCAAYNFVDKAETEFIKAFNVNSIGPKNLAFACNKIGAFFVHYSTDYVFDGEKEGLYTEKDKPNPINQYGRSKLAGEVFVGEEIENYLIFRVSWVYGDGKNNFIYKLLNWSKTQEFLKIAYDEFSVPTSTKTVAQLTLKAIEKGLKGLFHSTNSGYASRLEWAKEVFKIKGITKFIYPVSKKVFNLPATRPTFSAMSNEKLLNELGISNESLYWRDELLRVL